MAPADRSNHMFNKQCKLASAFLMLAFTVFSTAYHFRSQLAPLEPVFVRQRYAGHRVSLSFLCVLVMGFSVRRLYCHCFSKQLLYVG